MNNEIKDFAKNLGFDLVKIIEAKQLPEAKKKIENWINSGFEGDMKYMKKEPEKRSDPQKILSGARSIICLAMNYYQKGADSNYKVARYAFGKDYHKVIDKKLKKLRQFIMEKTGASKQDFKLYADAGPFLERAFAAQAELGFIGKNTTLITREFGSWVFLAEIITTIKLNPDPPAKNFMGSCGSCTKCIDACPAKALQNPYRLDARKCISYQTIEKKGRLTEDIKDRAFGCDICQEVCPHNCRAKKTKIPEFLNHIAGSKLNPDEIQNMSQEEFDQKFAGSPIKRAGLKGLKRNLKL